MSSTNTPLPPGRDGLPLLGETLSFARNPFQFIEQRLARHGRIFRSNVLGRKTVVVAGPDAAGKFIDPGIIMREGSMPPHVQELFGGRSLPLLDGEAHRARKKLVNQAFNRAALSAYLPIMQQSVERYFHTWGAGGEIRWLDELKRLSIEVICTTVLGMPPGDELDRMRTDYALVTNGFATLPVNLPGTRYRKALQARDRILAVLRRLVRERRQSRTDDGLSRMLSAADTSGTALSDDEAALELHHMVIAGFIVYGELCAMAQQLAAHADVRTRLTAEIAANAPDGALSLESLMRMPYLLQVVNEVKRLCPIIPAVFGKTKVPMQLDGVSVPAGWMVMWAVTPSHIGQSVYSNPTAFDPDRFSPERAEQTRHEHAFAPQGAGPATGHRCPGLDFATYFMEVFAVVLLRGFSWTFPEQDYALDFSRTPPEPKDGLRAVIAPLGTRTLLSA
jgi:cytochrome P450